ncbi:helix-turn-helix domain-containing protein [Nocardiopsis halophila]|uniref:helix-turn-helix domain-containing protein n=1 Tax=Nocardiopsis halophila TaxID=141692 RepID=UPI00034A0FDE|nr:helix-turn-helix transcriptional regulator [Nocardiopsis halophila]
MRSHTDRDATTEIGSALPGLRRASGLPVVFGGAVRATGRVHYTELFGAGTEAIRGLVVLQGRGLGGKAVSMRRPLWVPDYLEAEQISHEYDEAVRAEGLKALVATPIVVGGRERGVLLGGLRRSLALGDRTVAAFEAAAREAGQRIAVRDEARRREAEARRAQAAAEEPGPASPRWSEVRALNAELRSLAADVEDGALRGRLLEVCARMDAAAQARIRPDAPRLAPREVEVLGCVAEGGTNADTAARLGLRPETVKAYLRSAMRRLGAHTRLEAVSAARRYGLLP